MTYAGSTVTAHAAVEAMDTCEMVRTSRLSRSMLEVAADTFLAKTGKRISWPAGADQGAQRGAILRECSSFARAFNDERSWKNLEKWPFK